MPPAAAPVVAVVGPDGAVPDPLATPLTRGAAVGVGRGPFGPVLALRGAGLGADMMIKRSCTSLRRWSGTTTPLNNSATQTSNK
jgi:hypothetical protein